MMGLRYRRGLIICVHVGKMLGSVIPQSTKVPSDYIKYDIVNKMYLDPATENESDKIILNFQESWKGWDEFKPMVAKYIHHCIKSPHVLFVFLYWVISRWVQNCQCGPHFQIRWWNNIFQ